VISACYSKTTGALRVIDKDKGQKCTTRTETPLSWSQKGPTGSAGPPGPSIAYNFDGTGGIGLPSDTYTTVVQGTLPSGNYAITATLTINSVYSQTDVYCNLYANATAIYNSLVTVDAGHNTTDTLIGTASLPTGGSVAVQCAPTASNVYVQVSALEAIKVSALGS
jgi:hypothetical protein